MNMRTGLDMHRDDIGAGLGESLEIRVARRDHQMHIEHLLGVRAQRFHDVRSDGDVGDEVAVHDVEMDPVGSCRIDRADFFAQLAKVGGKN